MGTLVFDMTLLVLGQNIQGLIAAGMAAQGGASVTILDFPDNDKTPVTHLPIAIPNYVVESLGVTHHGFEAPPMPPNPYEKLPFYDGLKTILDMMQLLDIRRPPYTEKGWRDTWGTFEVGNILSQYDFDIQDLFARAATLSLVELLNATNCNDSDKELILQSCLCGSKTDPNAKGSAACILPAMAAYAQNDAVVVMGDLTILIKALKDAALAYGADVITDKTIRKIATHDNAIHSVMMNDETEYHGDLVVLDHDPVQIFKNFMTDFMPSPAFTNRIRPDANTKYAVSVHVELSGDAPKDFDVTAISSRKALTDFKADGGSQYPILSIVAHGQSLNILAQYFEPDLDNDEAISQAVKQSLTKINPSIANMIESMSVTPLPSHVGQPNFLGGMPFLQLLKVFSGHHALAYDIPLSNAVMAGYGTGAGAHPHVINGGERAATLYQSLSESDNS